MFKWLARFRKKPVPESTRNSSASITAMIDTAIEQTDKEAGVCNHDVQVKSRRAVNASRRVIANTGQYQAVKHFPKPEVEKS